MATCSPLSTQENCSDAKLSRKISRALRHKLALNYSAALQLNGSSHANGGNPEPFSNWTPFLCIQSTVPRILRRRLCLDYPDSHFLHRKCGERDYRTPHYSCVKQYCTMNDTCQDEGPITLQVRYCLEQLTRGFRSTSRTRVLGIHAIVLTCLTVANAYLICFGLVAQGS